MSNDILMGVSKMGNTLSIPAHKPTRIAILGTSGCGKSNLLQNILIQYITKLRDKVILYCIDPKLTSFKAIEQRIDYLCIEPAEYLHTLQEIETIMNQRYVALRDMNKSQMSEEDLVSFPMILLVIEEALSVVQNNDISKDTSKKILSLYTTLFTRARAANISIIMVSHSFSAECLPTVARDQLSTRLIMQTSSKANVEMLADSEMCDAHISLKNPGEFFFIKNAGAVPIKGKTWYTPEEELKRIAYDFACDKHQNLNSWNVKNPEMLGGNYGI